MKRRQPIVLLAIGALAVACGDSPTGSDANPIQPADLVLNNGYIYTVDADRTVAQAVAISDGRIRFVGADEGAKAFIGSDTEVRDLNSRMLLPGLHDMHIHATGTVEPNMCDFRGEPKSLEEMVPFLQECIGRYQIPEGDWLVVLQWPFSRGNQPSARLPTLRAALDVVSDRHPIILWGDDGHHAAVNSAALALAQDRDGNVVGISAETIAGVFADYREMVTVDDSGEPTGGLNETARLLVRPTFIEDMMGLDADPGDIMPGVAKKLASAGITSIQDPYSVPRIVELYDWLQRSGGMTFRVRTAMFQQAIDSHSDSGLDLIAEHVATFKELRQRYDGNPHMQVDAVKLFADGVLEGNPRGQPPTLPVAAVLNGFKQPLISVDQDSGALEINGYVNPDSEACAQARTNSVALTDPSLKAAFQKQHGFLPAQCERSSGVLEHSEAFIHEYVRQMTEAGFHVHIHALSDAAVRVAGEAFAKVKERADEADLTQSLAHMQLAHPDDQKQLGELGVYVAFTYVWIFPRLEYDMMVLPFIDEVDGVADLYNPDHYYMKNVYPVRSMQNYGAIPVFGSDAPVGTRDPIPFVSMLAALTRETDGVVMNAQQGLNIHEIIAAYTINGARLMGHDRDLGSIEVGKIADLIVLDRNLVELTTSSKESDIAETRVDLTVFDGRVIYERDGT
jgi:predicted amidohydrolase YtcJ